VPAQLIVIEVPCGGGFFCNSNIKKYSKLEKATKKHKQNNNRG
jgi:hypothetical protein